MKKLLLVCSLIGIAILFGQLHPVQGQTLTSLPEFTSIHMYVFDPNEFPRSIALQTRPCAATENNKTALGCTAFPNVQGYKYPYISSVIEVEIDRDYLPDVVPQEMNPAEFAFPALVAQSVAARSWILHKTMFPDGNPILNDESNQVFIPYKFEEAGGVTNHTIDPDNPCSAENIPTLTIYQIELCTAIQTPWYVTTDSSSDPTFTQFERDFRHGDPTINGTAFFDPISTSTADCQASSGVNGTGMTQRGASRWAFGNHCSTNNPQDPWSVKWQQPQLILQHYYPSTLIRSTKTQAALQPLQRWNPLSIDWGNGQIKPPQMNPTTNYPIQVRLRNTGIGPWACDPVDVGGPYFTQANHATFNASATQSLSDNIVFYNWDVDNDGSIDMTTLDGILDYTYPTPYSGKIRVQVVTSDGIMATGTADVNPQILIPLMLK